MTRTRLTVLSVIATLAVATAFVGVVMATSGGGGDLTVYSARSHYGEEQPFKDFAKDRSASLDLFGGDANSLFERLRSEGESTKADVLITVDAANLWRAEQAGLLAPIDSTVANRNVPEGLRDHDGEWYGLTVRARTIMRSTERVEEDDVTTYAGLGDERWKAKLCLRSGTSEYNISFVADRIAKDGEARTRRLIQSWMANQPTIFGSDTDVLKAIANDRCDVGLANSYYLGRELEEDEDFPVAPVWADQDGRGTHLNLSGIGVVAGSDHAEQAQRLIEFLTSPSKQRVFASNNHEFGVAPDVETTPEIAQFGGFKRDPIDVAAAGEHLDDAVKLMNDLGWR